jgi:hypothetical protein
LVTEPFRITDVNAKFKMCGTYAIFMHLYSYLSCIFCSSELTRDRYPELLVVPAAITDEQLLAVAKFRSRARIPVFVWKHQSKPSTLSRCSQPSVGLLGHKSKVACPRDELCGVLPAVRVSHVVALQVADVFSRNFRRINCSSRRCVSQIPVAPRCIFLVCWSQDESSLCSFCALLCVSARVPDQSEQEYAALFFQPQARRIHSASSDPRPKLNAVANSFRGGGYENVNSQEYSNWYAAVWLLCCLQ